MLYSRLVLFDVTPDEYCSSYKCPDDYILVEDPDWTVCKDTGCTKHLCCEKEGAPSIQCQLVRPLMYTYKDSST